MIERFNRIIRRFAPLAVLFYRDFQPGQRYISRDHVRRKRNPFEKNKDFIVEVIDAKDGWINYKHVNGTMFKNESMERDVFNFCFMRLDIY